MLLRVFCRSPMSGDWSVGVSPITLIVALSLLVFRWLGVRGSLDSPYKCLFTLLTFRMMPLTRCSFCNSLFSRILSLVFFFFISSCVFVLPPRLHLHLDSPWVCLCCVSPSSCPPLLPAGPRVGSRGVKSVPPNFAMQSDGMSQVFFYSSCHD